MLDILLVDDEPDFRVLVGDALRDAGHRVSLAANEKEKTVPPPEVTVSIGVADLDDITLPTFLSLHAAADAALYAAKAAGRDRVLAAPPRSDPGARPSPVDLRSATFRQSPP